MHHHDDAFAAPRFARFALSPAFAAAALAASAALLFPAGPGSTAVAQSNQSSDAATAGIPSDPRALIPETEPLELPDINDSLGSLSVEGMPDVPLLLMPDDALPLVDVTFAFRGGVELEPANRAGLTVLYSDLLRRGGAGDRSPDQVDRFLADTACRLNTYVGARLTGMSIECLSTEVDEGFELLRDVLFEPAFDGDRLIENKQQMLRSLMQRNSSPAGIARIHMNRIAYGPNHAAAQEMTQSSVADITPDDVRRYHETIARPERMVIAVRGDFEPDEMRDRLADLLRDWPQWTSEPYEFHTRSQPLEPGLYHVPLGQPGMQMALGIIVSRTVRQYDPDGPLLELAAQVLGAGGEESRMARAIQVQAGARQNVGYTAFVQNEPLEPSLFGAFYQAPVGSALRVGEIALDEYKAIAEGASPITEVELDAARDSLRESMRQQFATSAQRLSEMAQALVLDRPVNAWRQRLERIEAATPEDVARAIREHIVGQPTALLIAGDWSAVSGSATADPEALAERLGGPVTSLPMLDPMTLEAAVPQQSPPRQSP